MAVESTPWLICVLLLFCAPSKQDNSVSVEVSCGAGPSHVVLEPGSPLTLDCKLGASDTPLNISWLHNGQPLPQEASEARRYVADQSLLLLLGSKDGAPSQAVEGGYSCVSASAHGALTSRTINVLLAKNDQYDCHTEKPREDPPIQYTSNLV